MNSCYDVAGLGGKILNFTIILKRYHFQNVEVIGDRYMTSLLAKSHIAYICR